MLNRESDSPERWLPILDFEGKYEVSDLGRIRSLDRIATNGCFWIGRVKAVFASNKRGHLKVMLYWRSKHHARWVHRLVLSTFGGPPAPGQEVRHKDGNPRNNRLDNLEWGTTKQNADDRHRHGTQNIKGRGHPQARYTAEDFAGILAMRDQGMSMPKIAKHYGMSSATVHKVIHGNLR